MAKRGLATVILMVASFMDLMDSTITNVAAPSIQTDLGASPAQLEWTLGGYMIAFATLLITGGRLGDIFGRQRVFLFGVAGFTMASLLAATAPSGNVLVIARIIQGAFAGIMVPQVLSSVQVMYKPEERGPIFGIFGALSALGAVAGTVLGGWLVTIDAFGVGWRSIFLVNIPIGIILFIATFLVVPNSKSEHPLKLDLLGVILAAASVVLITLPLTDGRQANWPWWIWTMLAAAPITIALFIWQQGKKLARDGSPLLPLPLFKNLGFSTGLVVQIVSAIGNGSYALVLGYYVQRALGFTPLAAGLTLLVIAIGATVASPIAAPLSKKLGRTTILLGGLIQAAAFLWVIQIVGSEGISLTAWDLVAPLAIAGIGMMFMIMPLMENSLATIKPTDAGAASGTFTTAAQLGMALGIAIVGVIFFGIAGDQPTAQSLETAITTGLWVTVGAYLVSGAVAMLMPKALSNTTEKAESELITVS